VDLFPNCKNETSESGSEFGESASRRSERGCADNVLPKDTRQRGGKKQKTAKCTGVRYSRQEGEHRGSVHAEPSASNFSRVGGDKTETRGTGSGQGTLSMARGSEPLRGDRNTFQSAGGGARPRFAGRILGGPSKR